MIIENKPQVSDFDDFIEQNTFYLGAIVIRLYKYFFVYGYFEL